LVQSVLMCYYSLSLVTHLALTSFPTRRSSDLRDPRFRPGAGCPHGRAGLEDVHDTGAGRAGLPDLEGRFVEDGWRVRLDHGQLRDRKSTRLNSSHGSISYAVFCLKKKMGRSSGWVRTRFPETARSKTSGTSMTSGTV